MNVNEISTWIIAILILIGAILSVLSAFGLIRLPDIYTRSHAAAKSATLGILCILTAVFLFFWLIEDNISAKVLLGIVFVFLTAPVATHLVTRAAYHSRVPMWEKSIRDDLKLALSEEDYNVESSEDENEEEENK
ncbi:monovalent cation/H(+) antiporter subunit G [Bacillus horti]|uniref:Multicomponent Na+:H+ antiporter subunit G n=1 Tax=Caldalkalibacillus horti TaxID=77523 RepID=A0ABT9VT37_9BACI|nr:monovalent cation/H(+) antiporter subunit G [Bacillus horti]MDQ0164144.1 multicomponent Na+:H+ antiporter subunit G [Bacillus horti]